MRTPPAPSRGCSNARRGNRGSLPESNSVTAHVADLAVFQHHVASPVGQHGLGYALGSLGIAVTLLGQNVTCMTQRETFERKVLDKTLVGRLAVEADQRRGYRGDDLLPCRFPDRERFVEKRAVAPEEPFARCVQRRLEVFQVVTLRWVPALERPRRPAVWSPRDGLRVGFGQAMHRDGPGVISHERDVAELLLRETGYRSDVLGVGHERTVREAARFAGKRVDTRGADLRV